MHFEFINYLVPYTDLGSQVYFRIKRHFRCIQNICIHVSFIEILAAAAVT